MVKKVNDLPLEQITADLHTDLNDLHETLSDLHIRVLPNAVDTLSALHGTLDSADRTLDLDSPLQRGLTETLSETRSTLRAVRELADDLDRHPDSLLRGRRPQKMPRKPRRYCPRTPNREPPPSTVRSCVARELGVGCTSAPIRYYTLTPPPDKTLPVSETSLAIDVRVVHIPPQLNRSELMVRTGPTK